MGAGRDDRRLQALTLRLYEKMQAHARPQLWAKQQKTLLQLNGVTDAGDTPWGQELLQGAGDTLNYWHKTMDGLLAEIARRDWLQTAYGDSFESDDGFRSPMIVHQRGTLEWTEEE